MRLVIPLVAACLFLLAGALTGCSGADPNARAAGGAKESVMPAFSTPANWTVAAKSATSNSLVAATPLPAAPTSAPAPAVAPVTADDTQTTAADAAADGQSAVTADPPVLSFDRIMGAIDQALR